MKKNGNKYLSTIESKKNKLSKQEQRQNHGYREFLFLIFIVIQLQLHAFSPHPSTPPQPFLLHL